MDDPASRDSYATVTNNFIRFLSDTLGVWTGPAKIRRTASAEMEATQIRTAAEIERDEALSAAKHRLQILEMFRQKNLEAIAERVARLRGPNLQIGDEDWFVEFVESAKDTSEPTVQEIWAKLLAGEADSPGGCSKRTLHMVKSLSKSEASLINAVCSRVCAVKEPDGEEICFVNVFVERLEFEIGEDKPKRVPLFSDDFDGRVKRDAQLKACGFFSQDDYKFCFRGEGYVDQRYELSGTSARSISIGSRAVVANIAQPGLVFALRKFRTDVPSFRSSGAVIEFDAWRLSPEGTELFRALKIDPDYAVLNQLETALQKGGLSTVREGF